MRKMIHRVFSKGNKNYILVGLGVLEEILNSQIPEKVRESLVRTIRSEECNVETFPDFQMRDRVRLSNAYIEGFAAQYGEMYRGLQSRLTGTIQCINDGVEFKINVRWDGEERSQWYTPDCLNLLEES